MNLAELYLRHTEIELTSWSETHKENKRNFPLKWFQRLYNAIHGQETVHQYFARFDATPTTQCINEPIPNHMPFYTEAFEASPVKVRKYRFNPADKLFEIASEIVHDRKLLWEAVDNSKREFLNHINENIMDLVKVEEP